MPAGRRGSILDLHNNGLTTVDSVEVQMDGKTPVNGAWPEKPNITLPVQRFDAIRPGQTKRIEFEVVCPSVGPASIRAKISPDGDELEGDNAIQLALNVRKAVKMLVVDGAIDVSDPTSNESFFFTHAIDPNRDSGYGFSPEVISPDALGEVRFEDYDMVVLMDVPSFPTGEKGYPQLDQLEAYVRNGGGVAIFVGDKIDTNFYNGRLFNGGAGLSPFPLQKRVEAGASGSAMRRSGTSAPIPRASRRTRWSASSPERRPSPRPSCTFSSSIARMRGERWRPPRTPSPPACWPALRTTRVRPSSPFVNSARA